MLTSVSLQGTNEAKRANSDRETWQFYFRKEEDTEEASASRFLCIQVTFMDVVHRRLKWSHVWENVSFCLPHISNVVSSCQLSGISFHLRKRECVCGERKLLWGEMIKICLYHESSWRWAMVFPPCLHTHLHSYMHTCSLWNFLVSYCYEHPVFDLQFVKLLWHTECKRLLCPPQLHERQKLAHSRSGSWDAMPHISVTILPAAQQLCRTPAL